MEQNTISYNKISDWWDENRRTKPIDPCIVSFADRLLANASVLDIGCGSGFPIDVFLANRQFQVTGIDPSEKMIEKAISLKLEKACYYCTDLFEFETNETYDAVIAFDSLFHIPFALQKKIYPKVSTLLKPNGLFFFTHGKKSGTVNGTMNGEPFSYSALDKEMVEEELNNSGFDIVEFYEDYQDTITGTRDILVLAKKRQ